MKDAQVLELLRTGQYSKAAAKLYVYFPVINKLVLKNSGTRQDAEDLYQEALIVLMRRSREEGFVLTSSLNTYLYSVCRFLWNDQLKARKRKVETDFAKYEDLLKEEELEAFMQEEGSVKLAERAVSQLGEKCRQLLRLFYFDKMSLQEIATRLKFATAQVAKNQKYRCIEKAKENLKALKSI
jgi:RNA polymerase sigma factor (sigma-70 family)